MKSTWRTLPTLLMALPFFACSNHELQAPIEPLPQAVTVAASTAPPSEPIAKSAGAGTRDAQAMVAAGYKRYGIEKGTFIFRIDGAVNGTEHVYFDNWGWREAKYTKTTTELGTFSEETDEVQFLDGERRYVYLPKTKKATYFNSGQIEDMAIKYQTKDMVLVGNEMLKNMGAKPVGKTKVGEIECDTWEIVKPKVRLYMWQGLTMGEESYVNNVPIGRRCILVDMEKNPPLEKLLLPKEAVVEALKQ